MAPLWNVVINSCSGSVRVSAEIKENFRQSLISQPFCPHPTRLWFTPAIRTGENTLALYFQSAKVLAMLSCVLQTTVILGHARLLSSVERSQILQTGSVWQWEVWQIVAFRPPPCLISPQIIRITFNSQANFTVSRLSQPVPRFFDVRPSVARPGAIFYRNAANETYKMGFRSTTLSCFG